MTKWPLPPPNDEWKIEYRTIVEGRRHEIDLFWRRSNLFWLFMAGAFVAFYTLRDDANYSIVIANVGLFCSFCWTLLSPFSEADSWMILNYTTDYSKAAKNVCLVHHTSINVAYDGNCTIRLLEVSQSTPPGTLLPVTEIQLQSISKTQPTITITGVNELSDISIVGIMEI